MDNIIDSKILKFILIGISLLLIVFMVMSFPKEHINSNDTNIVSVE